MESDDKGTQTATLRHWVELEAVSHELQPHGYPSAVSSDQVYYRGVTKMTPWSESHFLSPGSVKFCSERVTSYPRLASLILGIEDGYFGGFEKNFILLKYIYNVVFISSTQLIQLHILFFSSYFLFHCGLSQDVEYISLDAYAIKWVDGEIIKERGFSARVEKEGGINSKIETDVYTLLVLV